jgi:acetylornithine deacetylase/succinyl-diaminopimelate desuccinylase-like protein
VPALTVSLRGGVNVVVEVATIDHPLHNGVYGGPVPDALTVLSRLVATLHDDKGDVAVAGLTRAPAGELELDEPMLRSDAGLLDGVELIGTGSITSRLWSGPAISVVGIDAPPVDGAAMTLVPRARAKITLRSGPDDDPAQARDALVEHLRRQVPWGARLTVTPGKVVSGFRARVDGPARAEMLRAFADAWGTAPVDIGVGGSIDFVAVFARSFPGREILVTGIEDPDTRAHGPNESLHLADFERACLAETIFLSRLARVR